MTVPFGAHGGLPSRRQTRRGRELRRVFRHLLPLLAMLLLLPSPAPATAREWFRPAHAGRHIVNADLTPARALQGPARAGWGGQLVLWEGRVQEHVLQGGKDRLVLRTSGGDVPVRFSRRALNLEYDRTGYRVAVKGYLQVSGGRVTGLEGRSVILLEPPRIWGYEEWLQGRTPDLASFLAWRIGFHNPEEDPDRVQQVARALVDEAERNGLDPLFLASLVQVESAYDVDAVSTSGALGLGQLMPFTAEGLGVDPKDPVQNVAGAARMIGGLVREWEHLANPRAAALSGYNAGPNAVRRTGGQVPSIPETTNYVYFIGYVHRDVSKAAKARGLVE